MIIVKLDELAKKLKKTINEMAEETGLNRNSVSALVNHKVDGIKFHTLETLCKVYDLKIDDILEIMEETPQAEYRALRHLYRQEGEMFPFFAITPAENSTVYAYLINGKKYKFSDLDVHFVNGYTYAYWHSIDIFAGIFFDYYSASPALLDNLYLSFNEHAQNIETMYLNIDQKSAASFSKAELKKYFSHLRNVCSNFWSTSLFIDSFDSGKDQAEIAKIKNKYNFTPEEIAILTTPVQMTFTSEKHQMLLKIAQTAVEKKITGKSEIKLRQFVQNEPSIHQYKQQFGYYASNYAKASKITDNDVTAELEAYLTDHVKLSSQLSELDNYSQNQQQKIDGVLHKYNLQSNPLWFFNKLTFWREYRKKINLMSICIMDNVLSAIEAKTGIAKKLLVYLIHDEVDSVLDGLTDKGVLIKRRDGAMHIVFRDDGYRMIVGNEAESIRNELEQELQASTQDQILSGQVASQGYAKGIARIILSSDQFESFKDGEILVAGMTRPEFVPLMKRAAGIVTNEGGVTCHAAIVSRELGKPCIIGTKNATTAIHDGDLIEVRAHHGTVRILQRAK
jgi:phosphoenolpyruvate synthase/pyruvate phosphate dikinase